jgi:hypothetical protein
MPMKNPVHPGHVVRLDCLEPLGLSVTSGAKALGVSRQALNNVVNAGLELVRRWLYGYRRLSAARRRRGYECSLPMTWQQPLRTRAKSKFAASTSKSCTQADPRGLHYSPNIVLPYSAL